MYTCRTEGTQIYYFIREMAFLCIRRMFRIFKYLSLIIRSNIKYNIKIKDSLNEIGIIQLSKWVDSVLILTKRWLCKGHQLQRKVIMKTMSQIPDFVNLIWIIWNGLFNIIVLNTKFRIALKFLAAVFICIFEWRLT
jgi:hypothetical protein